MLKYVPIFSPPNMHVMQISTESSQKAKNMGFVCALLVITIHTTWPNDHFSFTWLIYHTISEGIARISVPFFFLVSGFFLSKHMNDQHWYGTEIHKRIRSLVIPYALWALIGIVLATPLSIIADFMAHRPLGDSSGFYNGQLIETLGLDPRHGPLRNYPLWYVRSLFTFIIIAPIFKWLVTKGKLIWLSCAFALTLLHTSWMPFSPYLQEIFTYGFPLSGVFYFSLGIHIGLSKKINFNQIAFTLCSITGLSLLSVKTLLAYLDINPHVSLITIAIPFLVYSIWHLTPTSKWPAALTSCSFPIFVMHQPLLNYFALPVKYSPLNGSQTGSILVFLSTSLTSIALSIVLKKFYPRLNAVLFAGRN